MSVASLAIVESLTTSALLAMRPPLRAAGSLDWMSCVSVSMSVAVLIVVPERLIVVVGDPTLAKSIPASPPAETSSVLPAVVGFSAPKASVW